MIQLVPRFGRAALATLLLAACQPITPEAAPAPRRTEGAADGFRATLSRPFSPVDSTAFGALDGPDSLIVSATDSGAVVQVPPYPSGPRFPPDLRVARVTGRVVMAFVVDSTGHFVPGTGAVLGANRAQFAKSVCANLPYATYRPAVVDGRPRRAIAFQLFEFDLDKPGPTSDIGPEARRIMAMAPAEAMHAMLAHPGCP